MMNWLWFWQWRCAKYRMDDLRSSSWWRHQMETFSALLAFCAGNSPVTGEFPSQRAVTRSFDVFFDLRLNKRLSKQSWGWWSETPSRSLWRHRNEYDVRPCYATFDGCTINKRLQQVLLNARKRCAMTLARALRCFKSLANGHLFNSFFKPTSTDTSKFFAIGALWWESTGHHLTGNHFKCRE